MEEMGEIERENKKEPVYYCPICGYTVPEERNDLVCSEACSIIFASSWACEQRKGIPCWISLEVQCAHSSCLNCEVYKTELEIKRRGLNKDELIGNY